MRVLRGSRRRWKDEKDEKNGCGRVAVKLKFSGGSHRLCIFNYIRM